MIIFFFDRFWNPLGKASAKLPKGVTYYDDHEVEDVETGTSTFEVYVGFDEENRNIVRAYGQEATYFVTTDQEGHGRLWSVIDDESDEEAMFHYFYGEDAGMDLINEMLPAWGSPGSAKPIVYYIERAAADSGFEIGINEIPNLTRTLEWDGEATGLNRLQSIFTQFDNAELQFRFDIDENTLELKHKYIDILKKRGNDTDIELRMNREVKNIRMKRSRANMFNAYRCYGGTPEGKENPITLTGYSLTTEQKEINPETGKARFVLSGNILKDTESNAKYSRYTNPYEQGEDEGYYTGIYNSEATTQNALANETILRLKKTGYPEVNYEVDVIDAPRTLKAGDYVSIVNDKDELYLEGRILKTDRSRSNDTFEITLGDYLIRDSGIAEQIQAMADKLKGKDGVSNFIFYAYADDDKGTGFSLNPQGKKYTGLTVSLVNQQPSDPSVYTWSLSKGDDGKPGEPGKSGETYYPHTAWMMADGTFTKVYPNENLIDARTTNLNSNDASRYPMTNTKITEDGYTFIRVKRSGLPTMPTTFSIFTSLDIVNIAPKIANKKIALSCYVRASSEVTMALMARYTLSAGGGGNLKGDGRNDVITTDWQQLKLTVDSFPSEVNVLRFNPMFVRDPVPDLSTFYLDVRDYKLELLEEDQNDGTIFTTPPSVDYENAYPKWEGFYSSTDDIASDNPDDYKPWTPFMGPQGPQGEQGPQGNPGGQGPPGESAKEVISGYLSNESIIVPANSSGVVTDFSKAIGDFVVYEGQSKITSGVTYSKVSETGMTSTINSSGRYSVTALSSDVGTATYQAVFKGVTLQKIVIVVKNKQGLTGPKGDSTGVVAQNTVPTSPYVGMLWKNTGASGYIDGVTYRWTGSKWEIYVLAAANIVAETLAAISANLGTVTAGIIQSTDGKTFFNLTEGTFKLGEKFIYDGNKLTVRGEINADADVWLYNSDFADRNAGLHFRFVDSGAGGKLNAIYLGYNPDMISTGYSRYYIGNPDAVASQVIVGGAFTAGTAVETPIVRTTSHIATPKINLGTSSSLEQGVVRLRPQTSAVAYVDFYDQTKQSVRLVQDSDNKFKIIATYDDVRIQTLGHLYVMNVAGTGYRQVKASSFDQQSSISHKYDIRDLEDGYFDRFKEIKLHSYRRSDDEKYYQLGVIYEENIDQPFTHSEKGEEGGVDLYSFITFIGKALQESINKIEVLEEKLNGYNSN